MSQFLHPNADPDVVRRRLLAEQARNRPDLTPEQRLAVYQAALPPPPELYWHGRDGLACPCQTCCLASLRRMAGLLDQGKAEGAKEAKRPNFNRHRSPARRQGMNRRQAWSQQ